MQTGLGALTLEARNGSPSAKLKGLSSYRAIAAPRVESCCDLPGPNFPGLCLTPQQSDTR